MAIEILTSLISGVNFVPVLVATIVSFFIGWLYYSPFVFGKTWMKGMGIDKKKAKGMKKGMGKKMVGILVSTFVAATTISIISGVVGVVTVAEGATLGFGLWIGLVATTMAMGYMHGKSVGLYLIDSSYLAILFVITGALVVLLPGYF